NPHDYKLCFSAAQKHMFLSKEGNRRERIHSLTSTCTDDCSNRKNDRLRTREVLREATFSGSIAIVWPSTGGTVMSLRYTIPLTTLREADASDTKWAPAREIPAHPGAPSVHSKSGMFRWRMPRG